MIINVDLAEGTDLLFTEIVSAFSRLFNFQNFRSQNDLLRRQWWKRVLHSTQKTLFMGCEIISMIQFLSVVFLGIDSFILKE